MASLDYSQAQVSKTATTVTDFSISSAAVDEASDQKETRYINTKWRSQYGKFKAVPDLKSALLMKALWIVGKGYSCDPHTEVILENIYGTGKETFDEILFNMETTKRIGGDAFAEIVWSDEEKRDYPINLKVLNPDNMAVIYDKSGAVIRYEYTANGKTVKFDPQDIFHLTHNKVVNEMGGMSDIDALENTILSEEESADDIKKLMHRQARPLIIFKLKSQDAAKIAAFIAKMDQATRDGNNIYVPHDDDLISWEVVKVDPSALVLQWRDDIRNKFYRTIGLPQVVPGAGGNSTESESKVIYFSFEQIVEKDQRFLEKQIWNQLGLKVELTPPETMALNLQNDASKDGSSMMQPSDLTAGVGR